MNDIILFCSKDAVSKKLVCLRFFLFQIRDSAAIVEFLVWLEEEIASGKTLTEVPFLALMETSFKIVKRRKLKL